MQCVFNASFLFFHFSFSSSTDLQYGNTTGQFSLSFLEFLAVEVGSCLLDL